MIISESCVVVHVHAERESETDGWMGGHWLSQGLYSSAYRRSRGDVRDKILKRRVFETTGDSPYELYEDDIPTATIQTMDSRHQGSVLDVRGGGLSTLRAEGGFVTGDVNRCHVCTIGDP